MNRDNEEIHECVKDGYCSDCKGSISCFYTDDYKTCDGYCGEYDSVKAEWDEEDKEC